VTLGLFLARRTKERHPMIEDFMLACDGRTIAIEVPVYLQKEDIEYFHDKGFYLPLTAKDTPITGHIDVLQIRNGLIHILDYKPDANKINPVNQLLLYALALASRTRLPLKTFVCAWFDEKDYFSFYPLHAIHQKQGTKTLPYQNCDR
jgi:ATP-dependent exoDNAse (exonuclease V) beta subunit